MTKDTIPQTPEAIAYELMKHILGLEEKYLDPTSRHKATRNDILETYAECIKVVKGL